MGSGFILPLLGRVGSCLSGGSGCGDHDSISGSIGIIVQKLLHFDTEFLGCRLVLLLLGIGLGDLGSKFFELRVNLRLRQG